MGAERGGGIDRHRGRLEAEKDEESAVRLLNW